jgi:outer membrane protein W
MAVKTRGNFTLTFNGVNLTAYITDHTFSIEGERIDITTYTSTASTTMAGDNTYNLDISGLLDIAVDNALAPNLGNGTKYTLVVAEDMGAQTVTNTWTAAGEVGAEVASYGKTGTAKENQKFSCTFAISGAPARSVA